MAGRSKVKTEPPEEESSIKTGPCQQSPLIKVEPGLKPHIKKEPGESPEEIPSTAPSGSASHDQVMNQPVFPSTFSSTFPATAPSGSAPHDQVVNQPIIPSTAVATAQSFVAPSPHQCRLPGPLPITPAPGMEYLQGYDDLLSHGFEIVSKAIREGRPINVADYNQLHAEWMAERKKHGF